MKTRVTEMLGIGYPIIQGGLVWAGMLVGLINDVPSCPELIERMLDECRQQLRTAISYFEAITGPDEGHASALLHQPSPIRLIACRYPGRTPSFCETFARYIQLGSQPDQGDRRKMAVAIQNLERA